MANFAYTPFKERLLAGDVDLDEAANDIRVLLVMTNTTADTDQDAANLAAIGTLDEYDGANYVRKALANQVTNQDDPNNRGEFDADDFSWLALGVGTRQAQAMLYYRHVDGTAANDQPIAFVDTGGFPFNGNGGTVAVAFNAEGLVQTT